MNRINWARVADWARATAGTVFLAIFVVYGISFLVAEVWHIVQSEPPCR